MSCSNDWCNEMVKGGWGWINDKAFPPKLQTGRQPTITINHANEMWDHRPVQWVAYFSPTVLYTLPGNIAAQVIFKLEKYAVTLWRRGVLLNLENLCSGRDDCMKINMIFYIQSTTCSFLRSIFFTLIKIYVD